METKKDPVKAVEKVAEDGPKPVRQTVRDPNTGKLCNSPDEFINPEEKKEK